MATGPDPNRWQPTDPEASAREESEGDGLGNPDSSHLNLSSWSIAVLAVVIVAVLLALML